MRTLNATLESALTNQQGELILRVNTWTDAADYTANPNTPDHVWTCKAFTIESTTASADLVTENDYTLSAFTVFTIERGVRLSGVDYTIESGLMHVRKYTEDYGAIKITGSSYPNQKINIAAGDGTYQEVIEAFCTDIGKTAVFKNATDAWLAYQFLPTGKALSLNKAELFENLLKQKYCILVYEESPNNLVFYNQDSYQSSALNALTENAGALLAVATAGANGGMTSVTGADWIPQILPSFYNDVTYAAGLYVAVGASVCATSADGITWTARTIPAGTYTSLTYGNSLFAAVGTNVCATSADGITWTARTIGAGSWTSVIWTGSYLISASSEATEKLAYSTNGIDWIAGNPWSAQTAAEANGWEGLCWSPELSLFCAVAVNGTNQVQTSPDGINWTARSASSVKLWTSVCWSPELSLFCAVSRDVGTSGVMTSPDGTNWTDRTPAETNTWRSVTWSPALGLFCAVSNSGTNHVMTSPDGTNWTARASTRNFTGVCWSPALTLFVAVGNNAASSPDGITWTDRTAASPLSAVCWSPDLTLFVAVGSNLCYTSPDGINWTSRTPAEANDWNSVTWSPERDLFVAVSNNGTNQIMKSSNGTSWTSQAEVEAVPWLDVTWSPALGLFCAVATSGTNRVQLWNGGSYPNSIMAITQSSGLRVAVGTSVCYTSPDGTTWTSRTIPAGTYYGVTYGNSLYVAVGASVVATSTDGTTWTARTPAALNTWRDVIYSSTLALFIAVASDGASRTMTSADGITWTASTANADFDLSYLDGPTSYLDRQQSEVHFIWRDEAATVHTSGDTDNPQWNLGFLASTDSPPTTRADAYYKIFLQKAPVRLDITDGDNIHFSPYWSIDPTQTIDAMMQITEHLNLRKSPAWYQEIRSIVLFDKTEGGALPSTIERVAAYTPLVSTGFDGNLTPAVNNLQALAQAVDDLTFQFGSFYAEDIALTIVVTAADVYYPVTASMTAGLLNGITFANNSQLVIAKPGKYLAVWSMSLSAGNNDHLEGAIMINSSQQLNTVNSGHTPGPGDEIGLGGTSILDLAVSDIVRLCVENEIDADDIVVHSANLSLIRIGT